MTASKPKSSKSGKSLEFDKTLGARKYGAAAHILPSNILARHEDNSSRAALYDVQSKIPELAESGALGDAFCFTLTEVEQRLASLKTHGQLTAVRVYRTNTGQATLGEGYLRHAAFLLAEVRGELDQIPGGGKYGILLTRVEMPKTVEGRIEAAWANHAETADRKTPPPIDIAFFLRVQCAQPDATRDSVAERIGMQSRQVARHLQLLTLPLSTQLDVHEGRKTMAEVLKVASERGEGTARGKRAGVALSQIKEAVLLLKSETSEHGNALIEADVVFTTEELVETLAWFAGIEGAEPPALIKSFIVDTPAKIPKPRGRPKKAPPEPASVPEGKPAAGRGDRRAKTKADAAHV